MPDLGLADEYRCELGAVIECENQVLGEMVDLSGTPLRLHYRSDRVSGRKGETSTFRVTLSGDKLPTSLKRIDLEVLGAGRRFAESFPPTPSQSTEFVWDGNDAYGRTVHGTQPITVRVGYVYDGVYERPTRFGFNGDGIPITGDPARMEVTSWQEEHDAIVAPVRPALTVGGWNVSVHHRYDPAARVLLFGSGGQRDARNLMPVTTTVASGLAYPTDVAAAPDGSVYVSEYDPEGSIASSPYSYSSSHPYTAALSRTCSAGPTIRVSMATILTSNSLPRFPSASAITRQRTRMSRIAPQSRADPPASCRNRRRSADGSLPHPAAMFSGIACEARRSWSREWRSIVRSRFANWYAQAAKSRLTW